MTSRTAEEWRALRDAGFANPSMCIDAVIENLAACEKERDEWKYTSHNLEAVAEKNEDYEESLERRAEKAEAERDTAIKLFHAEQDTNADLSLRLEQMRGYARHKDNCNKVHAFMPDERCTCGLSALLSAPPGELAREVREVLHFAHNDLLDIKERVTDPMLRLYARRSIERIEPLLAKMGGEG